jgi:uncharacterized protein
MTDSPAPPPVTDELSAPLGQKTDRSRAASCWRRIKAALPLAVLRVSAGALGCFTLAFLGWALFAEGPLGGEPMAIAQVNVQPDGADAKQVESNVSEGREGNGAHPNRYDGPPLMAGQPVAAPPGGNTVTIIDGSSGKRQDFVIPGEAGSAAGDARFAEPSRSGPLPRIARDGTRPAEAFAQPVRAIPDKPNAPRIAVVVAGLGISAVGTSEALAKLPGPVTLAFAPYGADLDRLAARASEGGHELLLQVPMEPFDYPDNDPGPQTLLTSLDPGQNVDRLHWLMGRLQGYVGIANYMGGRFIASEPALGPVLREAAKRGLIYVEDGASPRSVAAQIASANNLPYAKADIALDAVPNTAEIDRALARLEKTARERGSAVGMANALPASIERIATWAKTLESRGIALVPITAVTVAARGKSS